MIKIAICDDEIKQIENTEDFLTRYQYAHPHIDINVTSFFSPLELLNFVETNGGFEIYLLDVYMDGFLGTETAKQLRQLGEKGEIVFITSSHDHAMEAYEVDAIQYLTKPYSENNFFMVMDKVFNRFCLERRHFIILKTAKGFIRLFTRDVVFTESGRNNYQVIHLFDREIIEVRMTTGELFEFLSPTNYFVRCGASININMKYVRQITKEKIIFDNGEQISYPYRAYQKLKEEFLSFHLSL